MNLPDELDRLRQMHDNGSLTDEEFSQAKRNLLAPMAQGATSQSTPEDNTNSLGQAANRYVTMQVVMGIAILVVFLIFIFAVIVPTLPHRGPTTSSSGPVPVQSVGPGDK